MQVSGARTSTNDGRKMYEMLAKRAGKIKDIYTHVDCGFPHPCPFYGVKAELISFGQVDLLAHSFKQAKSFLKKIINWTSWKTISMESRRSSHWFVTSWTDKFRQCAKYSECYYIRPLLCTWTMVRLLLHGRLNTVPYIYTTQPSLGKQWCLPRRWGKERVYTLLCHIAAT